MRYQIKPWFLLATWLMFASPILYTGCGGGRADVPEPGTYSPLVAVSLGIAASDTNPAPSPTPAPSGKCENCNGTGRLGDGTVSVPCPVCGGDGVMDDELPPEVEPDPKAVPVPDKSLGVVVPEGFERTKLPVRATEQPKYTEPQAGPVFREPVHDAPQRRGLFRRWRGSSTSSGSTAAGSC